MMKRILKAKPRLLVGAMDGGALETRVMALLRQPWARRWRVVSAVACAAAMGMVCVVGAMAGVRPFAFAREAQLLHATGSLPKYEVATIKPAKVEDGNKGWGSQGPATLKIHNLTVKDMLQTAYNTKSDSQLEGATGWMTSESFDMEIKLGDEEVAAEQKLPVMQRGDRWKLIMQEVLADRFHLKTSEVTKDLPVYELVVAKGGAKLKPAVVEDAAKPGPEKNPPRLTGRNGSMEGYAVPVSMVADALGRVHDLGDGRVVVDKTGLAGVYDFTLKWTPTNAEPSANQDAPGLFTAVEEQLGLKLVPGKAPAQVLVVEHVERPTEN